MAQALNSTPAPVEKLQLRVKNTVSSGYEWKPEHDELIKKDYSIVFLSKTLGVSYLTIRRRRIQLGVPLMTRFYVKKEIPEDFEEILRRTNIDEASIKLGVSSKTVMKWKKQLKLKTKSEIKRDLVKSLLASALKPDDLERELEKTNLSNAAKKLLLVSANLHKKKLCLDPNAIRRAMVAGVIAYTSEFGGGLTAAAKQLHITRERARQIAHGLLFQIEKAIKEDK